MDDPEQIDPDWARYAETILSLEGSPPLEIDLRASLPELARANFKQRGFSGAFAVLTAHDPCGRELSAAENKTRQAGLENELTADGVPFIPVDACSIDREHCECSVAIAVDQRLAVAIAARYEQMAIFWYDGDAMWLIGVVVESDPIRLPRSA